MFNSLKLVQQVLCIALGSRFARISAKQTKFIEWGSREEAIEMSQAMTHVGHLEMIEGDNLTEIAGKA